MSSYTVEDGDLEPLRNVMRSAGRENRNILEGEATPVSRGWLQQITSLYESVHEESVTGDEYFDITDGQDVYRVEIVRESDNTAYVTVSEEAVGGSEPDFASTDWGLKGVVERALGRDEDVRRDAGSLVPPSPDPNTLSYHIGDVKEVR
ncbi:MAG: hypothetical protein SVW02_02600 [Candidatus Nanohaloarchaea archaeon]|nr:hypothetical protein [Candidatus Nanohaloarchaea archaeon]